MSILFRRIFGSLMALAVAIAAAGAPAAAQQRGGSLAGTVTDETGARVEAARVVVADASGTEVEHTTGEDGRFVFRRQAGLDPVVTRSHRFCANPLQAASGTAAPVSRATTARFEKRRFLDRRADRAAARHAVSGRRAEPGAGLRGARRADSGRRTGRAAHPPFFSSAIAAWAAASRAIGTRYGEQLT